MTMVQIPHLVATTASKQLVVKGKPFLMRAAELQNSSMTSAEYMDTVWQKLADMNINTILGCVTWEMIEPVEGTFDFEELDKVILGARKYGLHLVLLWFGSFKNGTQSRNLVANCPALTIIHRSINLCSRLGQDKPQAFPSSKTTKGWRCPPNRRRAINFP